MSERKPLQSWGPFRSERIEIIAVEVDEYGVLDEVEDVVGYWSLSLNCYDWLTDWEAITEFESIHEDFPSETTSAKLDVFEAAEWLSVAGITLPDELLNGPESSSEDEGGRNAATGNGPNDADLSSHNQPSKTVRGRWFEEPPSEGWYGPIEGKLLDIEGILVGRGSVKTLASNNGNGYHIQKVPPKSFQCWFRQEADLRRAQERVSKLEQERRAKPTE